MRCSRESRLAAISKSLCITGRGWLKTTMGRTYANLTVDEASSKVQVRVQASDTGLTFYRLNIVDTWRTLRDSGQYVDEENRKIPW